MIMHDHQKPVSVNIDIVDAFHNISVRHVETNMHLEWQWIGFSWRKPFLYFALQNKFSNADSLSWSFFLEKVDLSVSTGSYSWTNFVPKWVEKVLTNKEFVLRKQFWIYFGPIRFFSRTRDLSILTSFASWTCVLVAIIFKSSSSLFSLICLFSGSTFL